MLAKQQKLAQEILLLQKQINILPDGKFICARNQMYPLNSEAVIKLVENYFLS